MTKEELLKYSAREIVKHPKLLAEFNIIFKRENGRGCSRCQIRKVLAKWLKETSNTTKTVYKMKAKETEQAKKGTFQLKRQEVMLPFGDGKSFLTKDSSDEEAIAFINFKNGKYKEHREKNLFDKLPDALLGKKKSAPKQDAPKKPAVKTKKVAAKPQNKG